MIHTDTDIDTGMGIGMEPIQIPIPNIFTLNIPGIGAIPILELIPILIPG